MAKLLKILGRSIGSILEWTLILIIVFAFAIRTSYVQTYIAKKAASYLSEELNAEVSLDEIAIVFVDKAAVDGLLIKDQQGDTLIYAERIITTFDEINLKDKIYTIRSADVNNAFIHIQRSVENVFNHAFIRDYFVRDKKKKNKIKFTVKQASLHNSRFRYDDHRKEKRSSGMDYFHLSTKDINGTVQDIQINKDVITGEVLWFRATEKCGFELKDFQAKANVSPRGVLLSDVAIQSNRSKIETEQFNMLSNSYNCFKYFVDSVTFDGKIDKSHLSLKDVAYFAYNLEGMDDYVRLKGNIERKVTDLKVSNLDLQFKDHTRIKGTINLDDYRNFEEGSFQEDIDYAYIDLKEISTLKLPNSSSERYIEINKDIQQLNFIEVNNLNLIGGFKEFVIAASAINTELGGANVDNGIKFTKNEINNSYLFERSKGSSYDLKVNNFDLGNYLNNPDVGLIDGIFFVSGEAFSPSNIIFNEINGEVNRFDYLGYAYNDIIIDEGSFKNEVFDGEIRVNDDNLVLAYDGFIDFKGDQHMNFKVNLSKAELGDLNISKKQAKFISHIDINLIGTDINSYEGKIVLNDFTYSQEGKEIDIPKLTVKFDRGEDIDSISINSNAGSASIVGKLDFNYLLDDFNYQFSRIFPSLYRKTKVDTEHHFVDHFDFNLHINEANDFLAVFFPEFEIAPNSTVSGHYYGEDSDFQLTIKSGQLKYNDLVFNTLNLQQNLTKDEIQMMYHVDNFIYSDSIKFSDVNFKTYGGDDKLYHHLTWEQKTETPSELLWETDVFDFDKYNFVLNPSYFHLQDHRWDIAHESTIYVNGDSIQVDRFELNRNAQQIFINGQVSKNDKEKLNFTVKDLDLGEFSDFVTTNYPMQGTINAYGFLTNPFHNPYYWSTGNLSDFIVNDREVGDIAITSFWDKKTRSIHADGFLNYAEQKTFEFDGDYFIDLIDNNLDFVLDFDYTDLQFTNAFMDPDVLSEIKGFIDGELHLTGTPTYPILDGDVDLAAGSAYVDLLGVHFGVDGGIEVDEYGFYINGIPVFDEEGNSGLLVGAVFHENFRDFNFDLQFDLEPETPQAATPVFGVPNFDKFLVMDLPYSHDVLYYGKGYVNGIANIFGYTDNIEITVNFKTIRGTTVNIPMYGVGEIDEENFITFVNDEIDTTLTITDPLIDFTGVSMDLNFDVTPDADINIIFNEDNGDIINANGTGEIGISLDNLGDVKMEGVFTVDKGIYNFAMGPVKQKFIIDQGGSISWTGDPYDADLNLRTHYKINANLAEISNDQLGSGSGAHQPVLSYLELSGSMMSPEIQFDIEAPQADDIGRTLINRIKADPDELNKQFFSLMLARKFQPMSSLSGSGSGSAAVDLVTNQINYLLSALSNDYKMNFDIDNDQLSGDNTFEFGITKGFLNDRLILSGSFGVEEYGEVEVDDDGNEHTGQLIGDINLEYLLNESGTFRVNIFNESTDKTIIQEGEQGDFTQGAGLLYKEDFNTFEDFKLVQYVLDVFRKDENKKFPNKRKRQQRAVPQDPGEEPKTTGSPAPNQ
jgi:hypothetical protein